ncbi:MULTISPECIES: cupin domain-containing protein [Mesobacillus]|uniref:cupin domain-containing protein n=1 Tax=Mesobacillus TaxID=2675231 RepID=UPI001CE3955B|nr:MULTISPECIES: cupin domain-containing protein [Mesobacillus]MCM3575834.1 cupin domain-containing protein [Mesobacillus subterraneus]UYZ21188.1 cupin domain-containing protein [Mesobacillus jeotgali]
MSNLYNGPSYSYPYDYSRANSPSFMARSSQNSHQQVLEALLAGIKGEASAVEFYSRLAQSAPNQRHKKAIQQALEDKQVHLKQFTDLFVTLTGQSPQYQIDQVDFRSYQEGLQKAYEAEVEDYHEYRNSYLLTQYLPVGNVFFRAFADEIEHATRFGCLRQEEHRPLIDYGKQPFTINIEDATVQNETFRTALWTGTNLQLTVMSIDVGDDIGLEVHETGDQFIRVEEGEAFVQMGDSKDNLDFEARVSDDYAILIPEGKWHNVTNIGDTKLKVYVIYAPPEHPFGTVHETKADAMEAE